MEICVENLSSAVAAAEGGAVRLELCSALIEGGLTPSVGLLTVVKEAVQIPVFCMLRPRPGNFTYSPDEIKAMQIDVKMLLDAGADGIVFGALTVDGCIDVEACLKIINVLPAGTPMTFHRAFDWTHDPGAALEEIIKLGFQRVLTSGCAPTAIEGINLLQLLVKQAGERIKIMPGAGIKPSNLWQIVSKTGATEFGELAATEFHASASDMKEVPVHHNPQCSMGTQDLKLRAVNATTVVELTRIIKDFRLGIEPVDLREVEYQKSRRVKKQASD